MSKTIYDHEATITFKGTITVNVHSTDKEIEDEQFWNVFENLNCQELAAGIDFDTAKIESVDWDIYYPDEDDVVY